MKPTDDLFKLIKSLTKQEKRYFKLQAKSAESERNYSLLFDLIDKQESYDENLLKKKLSKEPSIVKHLPSEKNYLHKNILRSLRFFHDEISVNARLEGYLRNIEILYKKRLLNTCGKQLNKAFEIAKEYECYNAWVQLIDWRYKLFSRTESYLELTAYDQNGLKDKFFCFEKMKEIALAEKITYEVIAIDRLIGTSADKKARARLKELFHEAKQLEKNIENNFFASELILTALYFISYLCQDFKNALKYNKAVVELFEAKPQFRRERAARYYSHQTNIIRRLIELKEYKQVEKHINAIKEFVNSTDQVVVNEITPEMNTILYIHELEYLGDTGQGEKARHAIREFHKLAEAGRTSEEASLTYAAGVNELRIAFLNGEYSIAQKLLKKIVQSEHSNQRDLVEYGFIIRCLLSIELKKQELFSFLASEGRSIFMQEKQNTMALYFFDLLDQLAKGEKFKESVSAFKTKITARETEAPKFSELLSAWVESKIKGIGIAEIIRDSAELRNRKHKLK